MRLAIDGEEHVLRPGDAMTVPVGAPHSQRPATSPGACASSSARRATPRRSCAGLAEMDVNRFGWPSPRRRRRAGARLRRQRPRRQAAAARPARAVEGDPRARLARVRVRRRVGRRCAARGGVRRHRRRPQLPASGGSRSTSTSTPTASRSSARSRASTSRAGCPTTCTRARGSSRLEPPHVVEGEVDGDLRGHGRWTLTDRPAAARTCASTGRCTPTAPLLRRAHAGAAPGVPLEPRVGDRARGRGPRALRPRARAVARMAARRRRSSPKRSQSAGIDAEVELEAVAGAESRPATRGRAGRRGPRRRARRRSSRSRRGR